MTARKLAGSFEVFNGLGEKEGLEKRQPLAQHPDATDNPLAKLHVVARGGPQGRGELFVLGEVAVQQAVEFLSI